MSDENNDDVVPCVVNAVDSEVIRLSLLLLPASCRRVQLPVVQAVQEHLGQIIHRLPLGHHQMAKLVDDKVGHALQQTDRQLLESASQPLQQARQHGSLSTYSARCRQ